MNCKSTQQVLSEYYDERVESLPEEVSVHIRQCQKCSDFFIQLPDVDNMLSRAIPDSPDMSVYLSNLSNTGLSGYFPRKRFALKLAFAACMGIVLAFVVILHQSTFIINVTPENFKTSDTGKLPTSKAIAQEIQKKLFEIQSGVISYYARLKIEESLIISVSEKRYLDREIIREVWFDAPEKYRSEYKDLTDYPEIYREGRKVLWGSASLLYINDGISEVRLYPIAGSETGETMLNKNINPSPFDAVSSSREERLSDTILLLQGLKESNFDVIAEENILGYQAYKIRTIGKALPWPTMKHEVAYGGIDLEDSVLIWIDKKTWFPLKVEIYSKEIDGYDANLKLKENGLKARITFEEVKINEPIDQSVFSNKNIKADKNWVQDYAFTDTPIANIESELGYKVIGPDFLPRSMKLYRTGKFGHTPELKRSLISYSSGLYFLRIVQSPVTDKPNYQFLEDDPVKQVRIKDETHGYLVREQGEIRWLMLLAKDRQIMIETNLPESELLKAAASMNKELVNLPEAWLYKKR